MSTGGVIGVVAVIAVVVVVAMLLRGSVQVEGETPSGWKARVRGGRAPKPVAPPSATIKNSKAKLDAVATSTGSAELTEVESTEGGLRAEAGRNDGTADPKV